MFEHYKKLTELAAAEAAERVALEEAQQRRMQEKVMAAAAGERGPVANPGAAVVKTIVKQTRKNLKGELGAALGKVEVTRTTPPPAAEKPEHDLSDPLTWLRLAAVSDHEEALVRLGNEHLRVANLPGEPSEPDLRLAVELYERAADKRRSAEAAFNLGHIFYEGNGPCGVEADQERALGYFRKAADWGDHDAMYFLGVATDDVGLVRRAAEAKHGGAMNYLALFNYADEAVPEAERLERFRAELQAAAEEGDDADAMALLASCFFKGEDGFPVNPGLALKWWLAAAQNGNADAAVSAGALLYKGFPPIVKEDRHAAFQMYQRAGELGSVDGWRNVAACYATGDGVPQCERSAKHIVDTILKDR
jgi:TPR repeat protein